MARVGTMEAATAAMLLLAVVVATAAAMSPPDAVDDLPAAAAGGTAGTFLPNGNPRRSNDGGDGQNSPLTELALCVSTCGSNVANCIMTKCYEPLARGKGNPMMVPLCLLACATDVMSCATSCPNAFAH